MVKLKVPESGDIVWLSFTPQVGREQTERRPALVISPQEYNRKSDLAIFCPITNQEKGYPFEVKIPGNLEIKGIILSDQVRSLDWKTQNAEFICKLPKATLIETLNKISVLLNP